MDLLYIWHDNVNFDDNIIKIFVTPLYLQSNWKPIFFYYAASLFQYITFQLTENLLMDSQIVKYSSVQCWPYPTKFNYTP